MPKENDFIVSFYAGTQMKQWLVFQRKPRGCQHILSFVQFGDFLLQWCHWLTIPFFSAWCLWGHSRCERWGGRWTQPGRRGPAWWPRLRMDPHARKTEGAPRTSRTGNRVPLKQQRRKSKNLFFSLDRGRKGVVTPVSWRISSSRSVTASSCITSPPMMNSSRPSFMSCRT